MVPKQYSKTTINEGINQSDIYTLNQIPGVNLTRKVDGEFALNDLVLELSHFIDEETVNRVEMELMSQRIKEEWGLPADFKVIETRNKEVGMVINELEEMIWRVTGVFDQRDKDGLVQMFSVNRNKDYFDQLYYEQDMQSMKDFVDQIACFDDKNKLLEEWVVRKELEIKSRRGPPTKKFQQPDQALF